MLGSLFLFIASFSIIAGIMLLVNIFVMLADERRAQLGMLRAMGMRRRRVTAGFAVEGVVYTAARRRARRRARGARSARAVVGVAVHILNGFATGDKRLASSSRSPRAAWSTASPPGSSSRSSRSC